MKCLPRPRAAIVFFISLVTLSSCKQDSGESQGRPVSESEEAVVAKKGREMTDQLMKSLSGQLKAALQSGGPENAVSVCQQIAQTLTDGVGSGHEGVLISRKSLKARNPVNRAVGQDAEVLEDWEGELREGKELGRHKVFLLDNKNFVYYQPIFTQEVCLRCHGDSETFSPALSGLLEKFYPQDQAVGYREGELRGAFRVEIDLAKQL